MSQTTTVKAADLNGRTHLDLSRVRQTPLRPPSPTKTPDLISQIVEKFRTTGFNIQDFEKDDIRRFVGILGDDLRSRGYTHAQIDNEILSNPEIINALKGHIINFREIMSGNVIINAVNGKLSKLGIKLNPSQTAHLSQYVRIMGNELAVKGYKINEIIEKLTNDGQIRKLRDVLSFIEKEKKLLNEGVGRRIEVEKRKGSIDSRKITEMRQNIEQTISDEITQRAKRQANTIKAKSNIIDFTEARKKHQPSSSSLEEQPRNKGTNFRRQPNPPVTSLNFKKPPPTSQNEIKSDPRSMPPLSIATAAGAASINPSAEVKIHSNPAPPRAYGSAWIDPEMGVRAAPKYDGFSAAKSSIKAGFTPPNLISGGVLSFVGGGVIALGGPKVQPYLFIPKDDKEHELDQKIARFKVGAGAVRGLITGIAAVPVFLGTTALAAPTGPFAPVIGFGVALGTATIVDIPLKMLEEKIEHTWFYKGKQEQRAERAPREMLHLYSRATAIRIWLKNIDTKIIRAEKMIGSKIIKPLAPRTKEIEILQELMRDLGYYRGGIPLDDISTIFFDEWKNGKQPWDKFFDTENGVMFFKPEITEKYIKKEIKNPEEQKEMLDLFRARNKPIINGVLDKSTLKALEAFFGRDISQVNRETFVEIRKALISYADKCQAESEAIGKKYGITIQWKKTHK